MCYVHHESVTGAHRDQMMASDLLELEQLRMAVNKHVDVGEKKLAFLQVQEVLSTSASSLQLLAAMS